MPAGTILDPPLSYNWNDATGNIYNGHIGTGTLTYPDTWRRVTFGTEVGNLFGNYSVKAKCVGPSFLPSGVSTGISATQAANDAFTWTFKIAVTVGLAMYAPSPASLSVVWDFGDGQTKSSTLNTTTAKTLLEATHTFTGPVPFPNLPSVKVTDQYGQWDQWWFSMPPQPQFTATYDEDTDSWNFDGSASKYWMGTNVQYKWFMPKRTSVLDNIGHPILDIVTGSSFPPFDQFDVGIQVDEQISPEGGQWFHSKLPDGTIPLRVRLDLSVDPPPGYGYVPTWTNFYYQTIYLPAIPQPAGFGIAEDATGAIYIAGQSGANTQIYLTYGTASQKTALALVPNASMPSLWFDHSRLWLHAQKNKAEWRFWQSNDRGKTFTESFMSWDSNHTNGDSIGLKGGGKLVSAVEKTTKQLKTKVTYDNGVTWSPTVVVATLAKAELFRLRQRTEVGSSEIVLANSNLTTQYRSLDSGASWNPF
jgi:hypothetical protein